MRKLLNPSLFTPPHKWIVFYHKDGRILAAMIKNQKDLKYYKTRPDIQAHVLVIAFNKSEAWRKGRDLLKAQSPSP